MYLKKQSVSYILAFTFVSAVAFIYLFIAIGFVPYWQELDGFQIQIWFSGPFNRFSYLMIPVHLLSIITMIGAYRLHKNTRGNLKKLWFLSLVTLLICQMYNFTLFSFVYNPALQSGILEPLIALKTLDNWGFHHNVRTFFVWISLIGFIIIGINSKKKNLL
ncbi:hypothetical protein [Aquimarina sp. 2201CG5-10]|uniref:hypothetical protein n=1 Tax=Aquimarina callyspongiae TaxID=3098150 RepID=UPI002AB4EFCB|nr:hypothetical protein [Aquimarina sp. 2201CG5-10]MDY8134342.1 hypothetical protein [Aquimarina sp. 2201CG5-10]